MKKGKSLLLTGAVILGISSTSFAQETVLLSGPMTASKDPATIEIVGGKIEIPPTAIAYIDGAYSGNAREALRTIGGSGNVTAAVVSNSPTAEAAEFHVSTTSQYVAGASPVVLTGAIDSVSERLARISVRGVQISYADALSDLPNLRFFPGERVRVVGTQPATHSTVLATSITKVAKPGISGSGLTPTQPSSPLAPGISGSGIVPQQKSATSVPRTTAVLSPKGISGSGITTQPKPN
jgi:hypothetical protein